MIFNNSAIFDFWRLLLLNNSLLLSPDKVVYLHQILLYDEA